MSMKTQVVIIGGGPGGSTLAMYLARYGIQSTIVEKDAFPRFHIGESMTGECGGVVRDLGLEQEMLKRKYPVKHGVKVFGAHSWFLPVMMRTPSGLVDQTTWQMRRSDFDQMMLDEALARGANLVIGQAYRPILGEDGSVTGVQVQLPDGRLMKIESQVLVDASGQSTWLANHGGVTGPKYMGNYDRQMAIFSHFTGGIRDSGGPERENQPDNTLIFYKAKYHWGWWIPIDDQTVSIGIVSPAAYFRERKESKEEFLTREVMELHPNLSDRLPRVEMVNEVRAIKNYSYQVKNFSGKGFLCIGDAHRFIDPIFSFGLYVTMKEAQMAAPVINEYLQGKNREKANPFSEHQVQVEKGIDVLEDALDGFWEHPFAFAYLVHAKYRENMIDVFAGRIYEGQPSPAVDAFRTLLKRERNYADPDTYSVPIGSRYHPERAPLWYADADEQIGVV